MKSLVCTLGLLLVVCWSSVSNAQGPLYELRVYQPKPGMRNDLLSFMNKSVLRLAKENGLEMVAGFVPVAEDDDRIVTLVRHKDRESCDAAYEKMHSDPKMQAVFAEAFPSGSPVGSLTRVFLTHTDYSPEFAVEEVGNRVFELRTYITSPNNLDALNSRFRDHTMKLFARHGMNNLIYWNIADGDTMLAKDMLLALSPKNQGKADIADELSASGNTLVYFLTHDSQDAAKGSFDAFRQDPEWNTVRTESEKKAGGSLTAGNGVKSWFLKPVDFSPIK
jgi:hypothetical protein